MIERIEADINGRDLLHADDTPIRELDRSLHDKGLAKASNKAGSEPMCGSEPLMRHWSEHNGERPWAGAAPPGAVYRFAPDWKEEHVLSHLTNAWPSQRKARSPFASCRCYTL